MQWYKSRGLSLLELVIGIALSLTLVQGMYHFLMSQSLHGQWLQMLLNMHQRRYAVQALLQHSAQKAGYSGCLRWGQRYPQGFLPIEVIPAADLGTTLLKPASDMVVFRYWQPLPATMVRQILTNQLTVESDYTFTPGMHLILHDCQHMQTLKVREIYTAGNLKTLISAQPLREDWQFPQLAQPITERWVVAIKVRKHQQLRWALFQQYNMHPWQEIVSDVYALRILLKNPLQLDFVIGSETEVVATWSGSNQRMTLFKPTDRRFCQQWHYQVIPFTS